MNAGLLSGGIVLIRVLFPMASTVSPEGPDRMPAVFAAGTVSLPGTHEGFNGFDGDGSLVFTRCRADFTGCEILEARARGGDWQIEGRVPFARGGTVAGATLGPGPAATFHSTPKLPGEGTGADWKIWEAVWGGATWSRRRLSAPVNTAARECCAAPDGRGLLYFASDRGGAWEIYRASFASDGTGSAEKLPLEINGSRAGQWPSYADRDGRYLLFSSIRPGGPGGDDIYVSFHQGDRWAPARLLPAPINSAAYEDSARVSSDGKHFFWSSTRPTASGDRSANVYRIEVGELLRP